ncbi:MAG: hypothetical protein U0U09_16585 [Cyclobacteriaceae bacterium]
MEVIANGIDKNLSGRYENLPITYTGRSVDSAKGPDNKPRHLWRLLTGRNEITDQECSVVIEFFSSKKVIAKLYCCGSLIDSVKLKGVIKDTTFCNSRWNVIPFFPLAFGHRKDSFRITLSDHDLIIDCRWSYCLYSLLGIAEGQGEGRGVFKRMV